MRMLIRIQHLEANETISDPPYVGPIIEEWAGEFYPITWTVKREQDGTGSWSFSVPFTSRFREELKKYSIVYFYLDGTEIMHGLVDDLQIGISGDKVVYNVSGLGEVALLDRVLSANFTHYYSTEAIVILQELLRWAGWRLGDFTTLENTSVTTTIDLREQETILQQIQRVCEAIPGLHYRWGGRDCNGHRLLDVGFFDEVQNISIAQGVKSAPNVGLIQSAEVSSTYTNLISEVHGNGGTYNLTADPDKQRVMTLWHVNELITAFPALENPDYPIVVDGNGFYRIRNLALYPDGASIRKTWDFMVTQNQDPPTSSELATAAFGLYQKCIRFLQEHAYSSDTYSVVVSGLNTFPAPGDRINVDASYLFQTIPGTTHRITLGGEKLQGDYRIGSFDIQGSGDLVTTTFNLTEFEYIGTVDADDDVVMIHDSMESYEIKNRASGVICGDYAITVAQSDETDVVTVGNAADCKLCEAYNDAISITVAFTVPTTGLTGVKVIGVFADPDVEFQWEIVQEPTLTAGGVPDDPAIICFRFTDHPWVTTDAVTITTYLRFWG